VYGSVLVTFHSFGIQSNRKLNTTLSTEIKMDLALLVYGISVLSALIPTFGAILIIGGIILLVTVITRMIDLTPNDWDSERTKFNKSEKRTLYDKFIKRLGILLCIVAFLNLFIPSERTAYMMVGAYATQKIAENDKVQETGQKVLTIINQKLDSYVEEGLKSVEKVKK
jgi:arginine exporter protein ArgO